MRSLQEARARWKTTFASNFNLSDLKAAVRSKTQDSPCVSGLRSICWKAFLLFENLDQSTWSKTLWDSRSAYVSLKDHFLKHVEQINDLSAGDPLADDETSPWNTLRRDEILRDEIYQDVERCMPENLYFREPSTQNMLLNILFIFCKLNADVGYRQGMHEVLAPILWVISRDAIDAETLDELTKSHPESEELLEANLDADYIEHDSFTILAVLMQAVKSFYELGSNAPTSSSANPNNSPIVERSRRIHEIYLYKADEELTKHLTAIEVLPQVFLIRWIRLLFGREFPLDDVLLLWDALFAEDPTLALIDFICVAMLIRIRWQLLESDYSSALTLLLRYPAPISPNGPCTFLDDALFLRANIMQDAGSHIISKYSTQAPTATTQSKGVLRLPFHQSSYKIKLKSPITREFHPSSSSPIPSPAKFLQEQGGIEGIIQEAARGVYNRGERWGVARALRGAVSGLQSGTSSSRRVADAIRWSIDDGASVSINSAQLTEKINALESRNRSLAKMLENAMVDLWIQQKHFDSDKAEAAADVLSLAIAKVQFVQVYLEDSSMPLPNDEATPEGKEPQPDVTASPKEAPALLLEHDHSSIPQPRVAEIAPTDMTTRENPREPDQASPTILSKAEEATASHRTIHTATSLQPIPQTQINVSKPRHQPFHQPRPSLAQSSFSWMLGEDQRKSSFVSAKSYPPEKTRENTAARAKVGFLFGEEKGEGNGGRDRPDGEDDEHGFTLGTLKGVPEGLEKP